MRSVLLILVVLLGLVAAFAVQNPGIVTVSFFHLSGSTSLLVIIVASFGAGILVGFLAGLPAAFRRMRRIRNLETELAEKAGTPTPPVLP